MILRVAGDLLPLIQAIEGYAHFAAAFTLCSFRAKNRLYFLQKQKIKSQSTNFGNTLFEFRAKHTDVVRFEIENTHYMTSVSFAYDLEPSPEEVLRYCARRGVPIDVERDRHRSNRSKMSQKSFF